MRLAKLKVKNTFIDIEDSDDEALPAMCPVNSAPVKPTFTPPQSPAFHSLPTLLEETPQQTTDMPTLLTSCPQAWTPEVKAAPPMSKLASDSSASTDDTAEEEKPAEVLETSRKAGRLGSQQLKVKNTFIDGVESDEEEDERPLMTKRMSMPCRPKEEYAPPTPNNERQGLRTACEADEAKESGAVIQPLHLRMPALSKGGQLHGTGHCKPCAWYWRPQGCANGEECGHCHLCSAAELKARKKAKKSANQRSSQAEAPAEGNSQLTQVPVSVGVPSCVPPGAILVQTIFVQQN